MSRIMISLFAVPLLFAASAQAQQRADFYNGMRDGGRDGQYGYHNEDNQNSRYRGRYPNNANNNGYQRTDNNGYQRTDNNGYQRTDNNGYQRNDNRYNNGYNNGTGYNNGYNNGDPRYTGGARQGGIGPGKGALIGGAGGAILGELFGGGLKGALIGGAAGAGIGAVVGHAHQSSQRRQGNYYPQR